MFEEMGICFAHGGRRKNAGRKKTAEKTVLLPLRILTANQLPSAGIKLSNASNLNEIQ